MRSADRLNHFDFPLVLPLKEYFFLHWLVSHRFWHCAHSPTFSRDISCAFLVIFHVLFLVYFLVILLLLFIVSYLFSWYFLYFFMIFPVLFLILFFCDISCAFSFCERGSCLRWYFPRGGSAQQTLIKEILLTNSPEKYPQPNTYQNILKNKPQFVKYCSKINQKCLRWDALSDLMIFFRRRK